MRKHDLIFLLVIVLPLPQEARSGEQKLPVGFDALFNGKDLTGWKVFEGDSTVWAVEDGLLVVRRGGGNWLMTEKEFGDFDVRLDYKMSKGANSGVAIRAPLKGDPAYQGMEIQLLDDNNWKGLRPAQYTGSIYDVVPPNKQITKAAGEWNQIHITARGRKITVELNGSIIVDADLNNYKDRSKTHPGLLRASGHLGLQSHGGRVEFRNLEIRPLPSDDPR